MSICDGILPSSCGVWLCSSSNQIGSSFLFPGAFSLVVVCRFIFSCEWLLLSVVAGGSKLVTGRMVLLIHGWGSSLVVVGGAS